jgi:iron complex outermembrane receptor protein
MSRRLLLAALAAVSVSPVASSLAADPATVIVTGSRFDDTAGDKPLNVSVINRQEIKLSAARTVPDLLAEKAGITLHDFFGNNAANTSIDMRGFGATGGSNTLVLLDGRRISDIDLAGVQWSAVPLETIERIEIMRGSGAVLYGDGATGGVINIITRAPERQADAASAALGIGSYGLRQVNATANHFGESFGLSATASHLDSDGYRLNNQNRQSNAEAKLVWMTEQGRLQLRLAGDRQRIRLPGARLVDSNLGIDLLASDPRGAATPLDYATRDGNRASLEYVRNTSFGAVDVDLSYRDRAQTSYFDQGGFPIYNASNLELLSFSPRARIDHTVFGTGALVTGVDAQSWEYRRDITDLPGNISQPHNRVRASQRNLGFYVQNTSKFGERLAVLAGARSERQRISASDTYDATAPGAFFGSAAPAATNTTRQHAAELGLRYQLTAPWALTGKLARSFRLANVDEIYEQDAGFARQFQMLKPQTAVTRELGAEYHAGANRLRAALFQIDVNDEIHLDPFTSGVGNTNLPPSRRRGLELEGKLQAASNWAVTAAYTYTAARFRAGTFPGTFGLLNNVIEGKNVPLVPRHKLNLGTTWTVTPDTRLNAAVNYVGKQYMDNDEANNLGVMMPAYTVVDIKATHDVGAWRLALAANNLFDRKYYNYAVKSQFTAGRYNAYPLPGRNLMFTAEYAFR